MEFPQYRKLEGFGRYYKITGEKHFIEKYQLNDSVVSNEVTAQQYPEILRIRDMLAMEWSYVEMSEAEVRTYFPE